jgi:prepilin-type processing-associated H-X9-DG protein
VQVPTYSQWNGTLQGATVKSYVCPSDPTTQGGWRTQSWGSTVSYGYNGNVFGISYQWGWGQGCYRFPASIPDGTSNTIFIMDKEMQSFGNSGWTPDSGVNYYPDWGPSVYSVEGGQPNGPLVRSNASKVSPSGIAPVNGPFMVQPPLGCPMNDGTQAQTFGCGDSNVGVSPHTGGINVALGDGSVRFVGLGVSNATWWAALTPAGGETLGKDW